VGHAHVAWSGGELRVPEIQDVFVRPDSRRQGVATALTTAAEDAAARRGHRRISISHGIANLPAQRLYEGLGYRNAGIEPRRVKGTIVLRDRPVEVDDTLILLVKDLAVDSVPPRSS